jgi:hypothetical protein
MHAYNIRQSESIMQAEYLEKIWEASEIETYPLESGSWGDCEAL